MFYTGDGSDEYDRFWMATHRQTLSFSVVACKHAKIALSQKIGDAENSTYEVNFDIILHVLKHNPVLESIDRTKDTSERILFMCLNTFIHIGYNRR